MIDSQIAGISGDMLLSAFVDLGANKSKIIDAIKIAEKNLPGSTINKIDFGKVKKHGVEATELILDIEEKTHERLGTEIQKCIEISLEKIGLSKKAKTFAIGSIQSLMKAESKIHGASLSSVHFHEASSIDTVIDIGNIRTVSTTQYNNIGSFENFYFAIGVEFFLFTHQFECSFQRQGKGIVSFFDIERNKLAIVFHVGTETTNVGRNCLTFR